MIDRNYLQEHIMITVYNVHAHDGLCIGMRVRVTDGLWSGQHGVVDGIRVDDSG